MDRKDENKENLGSRGKWSNRDRKSEVMRKGSQEGRFKQNKLILKKQF